MNPSSSSAGNGDDRLRKILLSVAGVVMTFFFLTVFTVIRIVVKRHNRAQQAESQRIEDEQRRATRAASDAEFDKYLQAINEQRLRDPLGKEPPLPIPPGLQAAAGGPVDASKLTLPQSIAWISSYDSQRITLAARWLAAQPVDPKYQRPVQAALIYQLRSGPSNIMPDVLAAVAVWGDGESADGLYELASGLDDEHRAAALTVLVKIPDDRAIAAIVKMLSESRLVPAASEVLRQHRDRAKPQLIARMNDHDFRLQEECRRLLQELQVSDDEMLPQILRDLESGPGKIPVQRAALEWLRAAKLSEKKRIEATQGIAAKLSHLHGSLNLHLILAVIADPSKESSDLMHSLLFDRSKPWSEALRELLKRGDPRTVEALGKLLQNPLTRTQTLTAIGATNELGEDVVLQFLAKSADDELNFQVCYALGKSGSKKSIPQLQSLLKRAEERNDQRLKVAAEHAIQQISERGG